MPSREISPGIFRLLTAFPCLPVAPCAPAPTVTTGRIVRIHSSFFPSSFFPYMQYLNTPERVACDRLLLNDTSVSTSEVARIVRLSAPGSSVVVLDRASLADRIRSDVSDVVQSTSTIILPGSSARICADALDALPEERLLRVPVSRRLVGLAPRGLDMSPETEARLSGLSAPYVVIDDVVASGTTVNGIVKRARTAALSACVVLACREPNNLRAGTPVIASVSVERPGAGFARINTLGTLLETGSKRDAVVA